jgi:hypothetical protein
MPLRLDNGQMFLFSIDPRDLAESIGLDWWAAKKLYDDKWLSFDPEKTEINYTSMQSEFVFLGSLVASGCDPRILQRLLADLEKPYCYDLSRIYYDWSSRRWKDLPYHGTPEQVAEEIVSAFEEEGDTDSLADMREIVQEALSRLNENDEPGDISEDGYDFDAEKDSVVNATRQLLWKIAASALVDSPSKTVVVGKLFRVFQKLPEVMLDENLRLELVGPRRKYGEHEIYHWWDIELNEEGGLQVSSGGHFYRPQTGGDSFTAIIWDAVPGEEPKMEDYLHSLSIVDDADTFENEVVAMDLSAAEYKLSVEDPTLEKLIEDDDYE